ncbi:RagB/SusD family nutrient uptake outer membrane protein [Bacteroides thetaiotaomicron]|nr:RagB/SusD family nutrient uptake outer membrane protein [Bacteroides thetaiotaomicron]
MDEGGSLVNTWRNHSNRPDKPTTQRGMREIIQKERMIELAFEGHRYHDVRRWKLGSTYLNTQIKGWSVLEQDPEYFYNVRVLFTRKFMPRDYLWPIKTNSINRNPKLVQNPQW